PVTPAVNLLKFAAQGDAGHRVLVRGGVTLYDAGEFFMRDETRALLIRTGQSTHLEPGDIVDVAGFPALGDYGPILEDATFRRIGAGPRPAAIEMTLRTVMDKGLDS